jgi:hypothetical protein
MGLRDIILGQPHAAPQPVATPEWPNADSQIFVRALTAIERVAIQLANEDGDNSSYTARLVAAAACDSNGERIFTDADVPMIGKLDNPVVERIAIVAARMAGIGPAAEKDLRKN